MRNAVILLVMAMLILSACAPQASPTATVPPPPSETPAPTATPTLTATPTVTPTATPMPIPTLPPEQVGGLEGVPDPRVTNPDFFNVNNPASPIVQFAYATGIDPEDIGTLTPAVKTGIDGKQFVVLTTSDLLATPDIDESGTPLMIAVQRGNGAWNWNDIKLADSELVGLTVGGSGNLGDSNFGDIGYQRIAANEFSWWSDTGGFMEMTIHSWPPNRTVKMLAENPQLQTRIYHAFWIHDIPPDLSPSGVENYFSHRANDLLPYLQRLRGRNVEIVLANEPFYNGQWGRGVFFEAFGKDWIKKAFESIYTTFSNEGLLYGTDYHIMLINQFDILPSSRTNNLNDARLRDLSNIENAIRNSLNDPSLELTIGLQFHIGPDDQGYVREDPNFLADANNIPVLVNYFTKLSAYGRLSITELDFYNVPDQQKAEILSNIVRAAKQSSVVDNITFWSVLRRNNDSNPNLFNPIDYSKTLVYYALINALFEDRNELFAAGR